MGKTMDGMILINRVLREVCDILDYSQLNKLQNVLAENLRGVIITMESTEISTKLDDNDDSIKAFVVTKKSKKCTNDTIRNYCTAVRNLLLHANKNFRDITGIDVINYINYLREIRKNKETTILNNYRFLNSYFVVMKKLRMIVENPMEFVDLGRIDTPERVVMTPEEVVKLRESCKHMRNKAIISLLASSGLRISELLGINIGDLDLNSKTITVQRRKHGVGNTAMFNDESKYYIEQYLRERFQSNILPVDQADNTPLFVSLRSPHIRLKPTAVRIMLKTVAKRAGVGVNVFPHLFRHYMISTAANKNVPLQYLQAMAGHRSSQSTTRYIHNDAQVVQMSYRQCFG